MTSSGAIRELSAGAGPGRSKTSFHYTGRATDLRIGTGMQGTGAVARRREATCFSLTGVMKQFGWVNIPASSDWKSVYLSCEWWHFQHHSALVEGVSLFGNELRAVWPADKVANSGLALNAVFKGRSFRALSLGAGKMWADAKSPNAP